MFKKLINLVYLFIKFPKTLFLIHERLASIEKELIDLKYVSKVAYMSTFNFEPSKELQFHFEYAKEKRSDINFLLPTLHTYAQQCKHITEMGVRTVVSTYAFLSARPNRMISIDMVNPEVYGDVSLHKIEYLAKSVGVDWKFIEGSTLNLSIENTELLFIDTLHTYDQLKGELARHHTQVSKYIILHDTVTFGEIGEAAGTVGLNPAVDEFLKAFPVWRMRERLYFSNGLTVLEKI